MKIPTHYASRASAAGLTNSRNPNANRSLSEQLACVALCIASEKAGRFDDPGFFLRKRESTDVGDLHWLHVEYQAWCGSNGFAALRFERFQYAVTVLANAHEKTVQERLRTAQNAPNEAA